MSIVVNVPRDERMGELGAGGGALLGAIIKRRREDKDSSTIEGVRDGSIEESTGLGTVSVKNRSAVLSAGAAYRADNPKQTLLTLDASGKASSSRQGRNPQAGETPLDVARFNQPNAISDTKNAISEIRTTQVDASPAFAAVPEAGRNRAARNINSQGKDLSSFNRNLYDKLGDLTGDNRVRVDRRTVHYTDYLRGENGKALTLDKNKAFTMAKRDAEKDLQGFLKAQESRALLTPQEHFGAEQIVPDVNGVLEETAPEPSSGIDDLMNFGKELINSGIDRFNKPGDAAAPVVTPDLSVVEPEVRVEEATQAALDANYPLQDGEEWVEVSDGLPLVPQSMMDVVRVNGAAIIAPSYAAMANIPLHLAIKLLEANAGKAPQPTLLQTTVIPDPVSAPIAPVTPPPPALNSAVPQLPGIAPVRRFQNPGDLTPTNNTFVTTP